jgi:hypothetical protein
MVPEKLAFVVQMERERSASAVRRALANQASVDQTASVRSFADLLLRRELGFLDVDLPIPPVTGFLVSDLLPRLFVDRPTEQSAESHAPIARLS